VNDRIWSAAADAFAEAEERWLAAGAALEAIEAS
jgi:hypothetical protein